MARLALMAAAVLLGSCSGSRPPPEALEDSPPRAQDKPAPDKVIARLLAGDNVGLAQATADSLASSLDPAEREIGRYWKAVCYLYRDRPDSALALLEPMQGRWTGGLRAIHSEVFLRLAREASEARVSSRLRRDEAARLAREKDVMAREYGSLKEAIVRLETEKKKYEKLLKDLETIR